MAEETPPLSEPRADEAPPQLPETWGQVRPTFRNRILAGLIFIVPLSVTVVVAVWIYSRIQGFSGLWVSKLVNLEEFGTQYPTLARWMTPAISFSAVIITVFAILVILWIVGGLSSSFIVRRVLMMFERFVLGVPVVRQVYSFTKQVVEIVAKSRRQKGQRVVVIEYPKAHCYVLGFATGETRFSDSDEVHITLFVPTTPNPTSGFMLVLPRSQVRETNLTMDQAARIIISGGIIVPEVIGAAPYGQLDPAKHPPVEMPQPPTDQIA